MLATISLLTSVTVSVVSFDRNPPKGELYALLVAGSNGWYNYRHQADAAHAYHVLLDHGVAAKNIIVMMYDDIATNEENPYKGKLFNSPNGPDVYAGLKIDYKGDSVTPENFLAVLRGDRDAVKGGNGRVIQSSKCDRIFVFFVDHGSTGLVAFPNDILTVKQLHDTLKDMHKNHKYSQLVFYLGACEGGSMFRGILEDDIDDLPCLGAEFSVNWMEDSDRQDITLETLGEQFELVKGLTVLSHVRRYGNMSIGDEPVGWFQGFRKDMLRTDKSSTKLSESHPHRISWPSRDVELMHLQKMKLLGLHSATVNREISRIQENRRQIEEVFTKLVHQLVFGQNTRRQVLEEKSSVINLDCHDDVVRAFDSICIDVNKHDYALKYMYVLNNLCTKFNDSAKIIGAMRTICSETRAQFF
nr:Peptidase C13 domain containing protein [Haemonchus contortus]